MGYGTVQGPWVDPAEYDKCPNQESANAARGQKADALWAWWNAGPSLIWAHTHLPACWTLRERRLGIAKICLTGKLAPDNISFRQ